MYICIWPFLQYEITFRLHMVIASPMNWLNKNNFWLQEIQFVYKRWITFIELFSVLRNISCMSSSYKNVLPILLQYLQMNDFCFTFPRNIGTISLWSNLQRAQRFQWYMDKYISYISHSKFYWKRNLSYFPSVEVSFMYYFIYAIYNFIHLILLILSTIFRNFRYYMLYVYICVCSRCWNSIQLLLLNADWYLRNELVTFVRIVHKHGYVHTSWFFGCIFSFLV